MKTLLLLLLSLTAFGQSSANITANGNYVTATASYGSSAITCTYSSYQAGATEQISKWCYETVKGSITGPISYGTMAYTSTDTWYLTQSCGDGCNTSVAYIYIFPDSKPGHMCVFVANPNKIECGLL